MLQKLAALTTGRRSRWAILAAWLALLAAAAPLSAKLKGENVDQSTSLLPEDSEAGRVAQTLAERFAGGNRAATVLIYRRAGGLTPADRDRIARDAGAAARVPLAGRPVPAFVPNLDGDLPPKQGGNVTPTPELVAPDGATAFTVVPLSSGKSDRVADSIEKLRALGGGAGGGLEYHVTGSPALLNDINTAVESTDVLLVAATLLLVLVLLLAIYRSPILAFVPLFVVAVSYVVASAVVYVLARNGLKVDPSATSLLLILTFGAGTDYCLLMVARYRENLRRIEDEREALRQAIPYAVPALLASGVTVAATLLTLLASKLGTNQTFGPVTAVGVVVVLLASVTMLPVLLGLLGRRGFWPARARVAYQPPEAEAAPPPATADDPAPQGGTWIRLGQRVVRRPVHALVAGVAVLAIGSLGLLTYTPDVNPVKELRADPDSKQGYDLFRQTFPRGAVAPSTVLVERSDGPVRDADVAQVTSVLRGFPRVVAVMPAPEPRSRDGRIARLALVFADDPFKEPAIQRAGAIRAALEAPGPGLKVSVGDGAARFRDHKAAAVGDLKVIVPLVLLVIFAMLVVLLRSLVAPVFLLGTVVLSFMGTLGVSLVIFHVLLGRDGIDPLLPILSFIFLVALGVDYNIFLMTRIREEAAKYGTRLGVLRGLVATGPVITSAGLILAGTFAVLATLPVWLLTELGFTVALGVLVDTFLVRTAIVPAITVLLGDRTWWPSPPREAAERAADDHVVRG